MTSPLASTLLDDCSDQCSARASFSAGALAPVELSPIESPAEAQSEASNRIIKIAAGKFLPYRLAKTMLIPFGVRDCGHPSTRPKLFPGTRWITLLLIRFNRRFAAFFSRS